MASARSPRVDGTYRLIHGNTSTSSRATQMPMNARLLRPTASGNVAVATDSSGNVIPAISYSQDGENYVAHIFNASGSLRFLRPADIDYLVVAGGGGGGAANSGFGGGGGGAGGLLTGAASLTAGVQAITVGAGGAGAGLSHIAGTNGNDSVALSQTAVGGGAGSSRFDNNTGGGSGGGAAGRSVATRAGGAGTLGQGNAGGGRNLFGNEQGGAGGGGAGSVGESITTDPQLDGGAGGAGLSSSLSGAAAFYAGGGGGSPFNTGGGVAGIGGTGGGGAGGVAGTNNTGGGGGGGQNELSIPGASGGSGIVIVRYKRSDSLWLHPEARDWVNRVYANGGTVSTSTAAAVDTFCNAIEAAGIRDRFYRLNLFCGTGLNAALVPLYRGQSLGGSQFGNVTDTNVNFAGGDYSESDGLAGAASPAKYLRTGLSPDDVGVSTGHLSIVAKGAASSAAGMSIGSRTSGGAQRYEILTSNVNAFAGGGTTDFFARSSWGGTAGTDYQQTGNAARPAGQYLLTRTSDTRTDFYLNGSSVGNTTASLTPGANANEFYVLAVNNNGSPFFTGATTARGYSLGGFVTSAQAAAYSAAISALNTSLGRT